MMTKHVGSKASEKFEGGNVLELVSYQPGAVVSPLAEMTRHMERFGFFPFSENAPPMAQLIGQTLGRKVQLDLFLGWGNPPK